MDPTNPPFTADASVIAQSEAYDNSFNQDGFPHNPVTPSGYLDNSVTPSGYLDNSATPSGYPDNSVAADGYYNNPGAAGDYYNNPVAAGGLPQQPVDLSAMLEQLRIEYDNNMRTEMAAYRASLIDDFNAVSAQRDAARTENRGLAAQIEATLARLERLERCVVT